MLFGFVLAVATGMKALGEPTGRALGTVALGVCAVQALYYVGDMAAIW